MIWPNIEHISSVPSTLILITVIAGSPILPQYSPVISAKKKGDSSAFMDQIGHANIVEGLNRLRVEFRDYLDFPQIAEGLFCLFAQL